MKSLSDLLEKYGSTELTEDGEIKHYGVPGMKWGHRKRRGSSGGSSAPSGPVEPTVARRKGGSIDLKKTRGGEGFEPSTDARVAARHNVVAKKSGVQALSNAELQALVTRLNLETNYAKAMAARQPTKSPARKFIDKFINEEKDTVLKGGKPKTVKVVETAIELNKRKKAARAAGATGKAVLKQIVKP